MFAVYFMSTLKQICQISAFAWAARLRDAIKGTIVIFLMQNICEHALCNLRTILLNKITYSFIHLENLYSAPSRKLLRGAPSLTTMKKISFKQLVEQRCVTFW